MSRLQLSDDAKHFRKFLDEGVHLVDGETDGYVDVGKRADPVNVAIVVDVTSYGPHQGAIYVQNGGHIDGALQEAYDILKTWKMDHYREYYDELEKEYGDEADEVFTETFDAVIWELDPREFAKALKGSKAEKYIDTEDRSEED